MNVRCTRIVLVLGLAALCAPPPAPGQPDTLTPRPRPATPEVKELAAGKEITTGIGDRRRLRLPDGSTLYVDQKTTVKVESRDRLTLAMMVGIPIVQLVLFGFAINTDPKELPSYVKIEESSRFSRARVE